MGRRCKAGRRRSGEGVLGPQGDARQIQGGLLGRARAQAPAPRGTADQDRTGVAGQPQLPDAQASATPATPILPRSPTDRFIDGIELLAAIFVGLVAADTFISVILRKFF